MTSPRDEAAPRDMLEIIVSDTGVGIPSEHLGRVFERFHRVDTRLTREVDGLGLGLAMCARIAEMHGGHIWAESTPGTGSAFHLVLPAVRSAVHGALTVSSGR
jgi:signal transduction histidine kinase